MRRIREIREREEMKGIGEEMKGIKEEMTEIRSHIGQYGTRIQIMVGILQGILPRNLAEDLAGILIGCNNNPLVIRGAAARIQDIIICLMLLAITTGVITTTNHHRVAITTSQVLPKITVTRGTTRITVIKNMVINNSRTLITMIIINNLTVVNQTKGPKIL